MEKTIEAMAGWLLKRYGQFKFYELPDTSFEYMSFEIEQRGLSVETCAQYMEAENRCLALARKKWSEKRDRNLGRLMNMMDDARNEMDINADEKSMQVLDKAFFSRDSLTKTSKEMADELGMSLSHFYLLKSTAEDRYVRKMIRLAKKRHIKLEEAYEFLMDISSKHEPGGEYYEDSLKLLRCYRGIKYSSVREKFREAGEGRRYEGIIDLDKSDILTRWMKSSMMENTFVGIIFMDEVVSRMKKLGPDGLKYAKLISVIFIDREYMDMSLDKNLEQLGMTRRVFYVNRKKAITMFSKILWGTSGYRHS